MARYKTLLLQIQFPGDSIHGIRYFTAKVDPRPHNPGQDVRQQTYLRALGTSPNFEIHFGYYLTSIIKMPLETPPSGGPAMDRVIKSEEKGSDVNLATYMILDAVDKDCDGMVMISNDSDLTEPMVMISNDSDLTEPVRVVTTRFQLPVTVLHPLPIPLPNQKPNFPSGSLRRVATRSLTVTYKHLKRAQFPPTI